MFWLDLAACVAISLVVGIILGVIGFAWILGAIALISIR